MKVYNKAFTLAEVLLTLAIIGVVAALTIPAVVTKVQQDQYVVGLKKAYNTLKSVEREAIQENGEMRSWFGLTGDIKTDFEKYFKPHFDILKDCGVTADTGCFPVNITTLNGGDLSQLSLANISSPNVSYRIITSDGMAFSYFSDYGYLFYVDVNGLKGPNILGRDIFI